MTDDQIAEKILDQLANELFNQRVMSNLIRPHYVERLATHYLGNP